MAGGGYNGRVSFRYVLVLIAPPVAGLVAGYLLGGRLAGFRDVRIRALWLVWLAAAVQFAQLRMGGSLGGPMLAVVFAIVLTWLGVNLVRWPVAIRWAGVVVGLGAALNGLVIALNGRMPFSYAGGGPAGETPKNVAAGAHTRLAFLGDVMPIAPLHVLISAGDILIAAGAAALVVLAMRRGRRLPDPPQCPVVAVG
jgi:hypothetical protein